MILFRRYPRWWFDWNLELMRFGTRVASTWRCSTTATHRPRSEQPCTSTCPARRRRRRDQPRAAARQVASGDPHYIVLAFLWIGVVRAVVIAWFAILFTGRYPRALFDFVVGVGRWHLASSAYALLLATDAYPPFRLAP